MSILLLLYGIETPEKGAGPPPPLPPPGVPEAAQTIAGGMLGFARRRATRESAITAVIAYQDGEDEELIPL